MEELVARHFSNLTLLKLDISPKDFFKDWLIKRKSSLVVSGSYGRSGLSQIFKKSFVKNLISSHRLPIFIAHQ
jgi:hypothetical protein